MKRLLFLSLFLVICSLPVIAQGGTLDGVTVCVNQKEYFVSDNQFLRPKAGNVYMALDISIINNSGETTSYNPLYFKLQDGRGYTYNYTMGKEPYFGCGDLENGRTVRGWLTFEIPRNHGSLTVIYKPSMFQEKQLLINI